MQHLFTLLFADRPFLQSTIKVLIPKFKVLHIGVTRWSPQWLSQTAHVICLQSAIVNRYPKHARQRVLQYPDSQLCSRRYGALSNNNRGCHRYRYIDRRSVSISTSNSIILERVATTAFVCKVWCTW